MLHRAECKVRYQVRRDSGDDFAARLTVLNVGAHGLTGWRLEFGYPGRQRLITAGRGVEQQGHRVVVRPPVDKTLAAGRSFTTTLRGGYPDANPLPLTFALNGHPCEAEVIGATTVGDSNPAQDVARPVTEAAGPEKSAGSGAGRRVDQTRSPQRARINKQGSTPKTVVGTPPPAPPKTGGGFTVVA
jgi:serine/threonine-protein kinase